METPVRINYPDRGNEQFWWSGNVSNSRTNSVSSDNNKRFKKAKRYGER